MSEGYKNAASCWKDILADAGKNRDLLSVIERFARQNPDPTRVVFGTSGWRGEIGTDYTFRNVRIVTAAIIEMFRNGSPSALKALGVSGLEEVRKRGVIVGHDNRFLGREFAMEVIGLLRKEGIPVWYAGEATTPEFSAAVEMLNAACSFNLTPSHNPANYAGFKFNPSDGGPAGSEITGEIEEGQTDSWMPELISHQLLRGKLKKRTHWNSISGTSRRGRPSISKRSAPLFWTPIAPSASTMYTARHGARCEGRA